MTGAAFVPPAVGSIPKAASRYSPRLTNDAGQSGRSQWMRALMGRFDAIEACKTDAGARARTAAGGEISCLDPGVQRAGSFTAQKNFLACLIACLACTGCFDSSAPPPPGSDAVTPASRVADAATPPVSGGAPPARVATAQPPNLGSELFALKTVITLPGSPLSSFDIVWLDPMMGLLLVTDRANKAVHVVDTATTTVIRTLTGFVGLRTAPVDSGPNGVITVRHESWAGDGDSTVKVHDLLTGTLTNTIAIPGGSPTTRVNQLCFSPRDNVVLLANDREGLITFISTLTYQVLSQIKLDGIQSAVKATNGIKQCQWNRRTGKFNLAVPENNGTGNGLGAGVVLEISAKARTIDKVFVIPQSVCIGPQGLAIGPERQILLGCSNRGPGSIIIDDRDGSVIKSLPGHQGADEVWFNDGDSRYFIAESDNPAGPRVGVVDSLILASNELAQ